MIRPSQVSRLVQRASSSRASNNAIVRRQQLVALARSTSSLASSSSPVSTPNSSSKAQDKISWRPMKQQRFFHSTPPYYLAEEEGKKDEAAPVPTDGEGVGDDDCPEWQNPLHHNNPDYNKHFAEDFGDDEEMPVLPLPPFEEEEGKALAPPHIHDIAHRVVHLTLLEMKELTTRIADHFGFDDNMMAASYAGGGGGAVAGGGAGGATAEEPKEEKTIFELKLVGFDAKAKIKVIKEVRAISGLGLKEAKELVENAPKVVQKDLKQDKADELKAQLEAVGAEVEIV